MKKILLKIIFLVVAVAIVNSFLRYWIVGLPIYPSRSYIASYKWKQYNAEKDSIRILFLGASRTVLHIDPKKFEENRSEDKPVKAYNLGIRGMRKPELFSLVNKVLDTDNNLEYLFVEFNDTFVRNYRLSLYGVLYWLREDNLAIAQNEIMGSSLPGWEKARYLFVFWYNYLYSRFNFSFLQVQNVFYAKKDRVIFPDERGFISMDIKAIKEAMATKKLSEDEVGAVIRNRELHEDPLVLEEIAKYASECLQFTAVKNRWQRASVRYHKELIEKAASKGVHLIFFIAPRHDDYLKDLLPVFSQLDPCNKLMLIDPEFYPQFYQARYAFDKLHLNAHGADIFSRELAREFHKLKENCSSL